jgi:two-component system, NtrC family, nitrogen regulation sensor histidine kinase NtrY
MNRIIIDPKMIKMNIKTFIKYVFIALLIYLFGKLTEKNILFPRFNNSYVQHFQRVYNDKEKALNEIILKVISLTKKRQIINAHNPFFLEYIGLLEQKGLAVFVYQNDSLKFWSDNTVPISNSYSNSGIDSTFLYLRNAWYVPRIVKTGNIAVVGLIQIKQVYQYENKFLVTKFQKDFNVPASVKISTRELPNSFPIYNSKQRYLFSIVFDTSTQHPFFQKYIPSGAYFLLIIFILWTIYNIIIQIHDRITRNRTIIITILGFIFVKIITLKLLMPRVFYELDLFYPQHFASSQLIPSLGDLLLWAITIFFLVLLFNKGFTFFYSAKWQKRSWLIQLELMFHLLIISGLFSGIFYLIKSIILNSTISFEVNKLLLVDSYSLIGYLVIVLLFASFTYYFDKILLIFKETVSFYAFYTVFILSVIIWLAFVFVIGDTVLFLPIIFFAVLCSFLSYVRIKLNSVYKYSTLIVVILLYSLYTVVIVTKYSSIRNNDQKKVLLTNLANERDPVTEYLLTEKYNVIKRDSVIINLGKEKNIDLNSLYNYVKHRYFEGYFEKYALQVNFCNLHDSLYLNPPDDTYVHCYDFFESMVTERGTKLPGTNFYYIDNKIGRINYFGWFKSDNNASLFVELDSKPVSEILGYPELLLDTRFVLRSVFKEYAYAKYYKSQKISQYGTFSYNLSDSIFKNAKNEYTLMHYEDHDHLIYRPSEDSLIVLSSESVTFLDTVISFSYTFVIYFLVLTIVVLFTRLPFIKNTFIPNFKNKIQYSMMSVLFLSLILIGGGTLYFNIRQYYTKHYAIISEKLKSIDSELSQTLVLGQHIDQNLLFNLSNIFYTDINLYDKDGSLIATSRPEIFQKGLIGIKINAEAYNELVNKMKAEVIHHEKIGKLNYISAYMPFKNKDGKLLAFLNLPYFTTQEELTREVSTMVIAALNMYVFLLMITFLIAVFISQKITMPLKVIQSKFSGIRLGQKYEKIEYSSNDEIGGLVNEYNRMVTELEKSIEMLAKSERESAWREMAKQIAHEINNPLTPMKLSVQHLQRAWEDKNEQFDEYLNKISKTLIDEIDNLSAIATEFSNFAKMPVAINQKLDLITKINNAVSLFDSDNVDFHVFLNNHKEILIYADKEQVSRVLINLFKNAIQSVAKVTKPLITVDVNTDEKNVTLLIKDNGKGIPKEIQEKLFRPNFTTKTSGMGLGLAIVKNIIESSNGKITYETKENQGTTFIIILPLYKE